MENVENICIYLPYTYNLYYIIKYCRNAQNGNLIIVKFDLKNNYNIFYLRGVSRENNVVILY